MMRLMQPDCGGGSRKGEWLLQQLMWEAVRTEVGQRPQPSREEARREGGRGGGQAWGPFPQLEDRWMGVGGELLSNNSGFLVWLSVVLTQEEWVQRMGEDLTRNRLPSL